MSKKKKSKGLSTVETGLNVAMKAVGPYVNPFVNPLIESIVNPLADKLTETLEERKILVTVPELCANGFPLSTEQATKILTDCGLKIMLIELPLKEAEPKYKDCFVNQVIETQPKAKEKIEPGSTILVKYITQEIIDESKRLYTENEHKKILESQKLYELKVKKVQEKANLKAKKAELKAQKVQERLEQKEIKTQKRLEQGEKIKQTSTDILDTAKKKTNNIVSHLHKKNDIEVKMDETEENSST
ncbi:MAG: hypothetical protein LUD81_01490 [Clostridiales bacterium]|nr:hypothetical protein [Clostridiales bacterium]